MKSSVLTVYGAVTHLPPQPDRLSFKRVIKGGRDRLKCKLGNFQSLDYRDYLSPSAYNRGDLAIAQAVTQKLQALTEDIELSFVNWGDLLKKNEDGPILISGSGYIHLTQNYSVADRLRNDLEYLTASRRPYALHGIGVNMSATHADKALPKIDAESRSIIKELIEGAVNVSVRDNNSEKIIQSISDRSITVVADPALFLKNDWKIQHSKHSSNRSQVGITIPFHGPAATDRVRRDLNSYIQCLKSIQNKIDCDFVQTVHFDSEFIVGKILQDHNIRLTQAIGEVRTLLSAYQQMDFHIGGMLHSCILSASTGTPCIGLAYDIKHQGFFDLLGQPDLCVPAEPFDPERLSATCDHVLTHADTIRKQINARRDELELTSNQFLAQTLQALLS